MTFEYPRAVVAALGLVAACFAGTTAAAHAVGAVPSDARIEAYLGALRAQLDPRAAAALDQIDGLDRRLLAARAYLRSRAVIDERWSWTREQVECYAGSPLQHALDAEIARVRAAFEARNPGYTLWVNPEVRSVELQLERWNANAGVGRAAQSVLDTVRTRVASREAPAVGSNAAVAWFAEMLRTTTPQPLPPLAAPGLSRHGRMQAVDFHVRKGDRTVAGPSQADVRSVWEAQGWSTRLARAVRDASDRFEGPLATPNEPWHYEYRAPPGLRIANE